MGIGEQNERNDRNVENQGGNAGNWSRNEGNHSENLRIGVEVMKYHFNCQCLTLLALV